LVSVACARFPREASGRSARARARTPGGDNDDLEAQRTGKSRDLNAAVRQFRQALSNERWLEESDDTHNP
jgi:hypothetical protein